MAALEQRRSCVLRWVVGRQLEGDSHQSPVVWGEILWLLRNSRESQRVKKPQHF